MSSQAESKTHKHVAHSIHVAETLTKLGVVAKSAKQRSQKPTLFNSRLDGLHRNLLPVRIVAALTKE